MSISVEVFTTYFTEKDNRIAIILTMIIIQDKIVSDELVQEHFLCHLESCKGACCWEGDAGAPLEKNELAILDQVYPEVKPYLSPAGIAVIEQEGAYVYDEQIESYATSLIDNGPCSFMTINGQGMAQCGIEQAWNEGKIKYRKPVSCQLYPIRVTYNEKTGFEALNYDRWDICSAACDAGKAAQLPVYQFLKDAITRKYGADFYEELDAVAQLLK